MRLSHIHEASISRRDFLQKSGGGLVGLLVGGGLSPEIASTIASPNSPQLMATIISGESGRYEPDVADSLKDVSAAYNTLRRLLGRNADIGGGSEFGEFFSLGGCINPEDVPKLLKSGEVVDSSEGDEIFIEIWSSDFLDPTRRPAPDSKYQRKDIGGKLIIHNKWLTSGQRVGRGGGVFPENSWPADYDVNAPIEPKDLIKNWWDNWEKMGTGYLDKNTFSLLRKNGIDPIRPNVGPEGGPGPPEPEKPEKPEEPEKLEKPHDYGVASPMHQWVENKSRFEAELDRVLSLN